MVDETMNNDVLVVDVDATLQDTTDFLSGKRPQWGPADVKNLIRLLRRAVVTTSAKVNEWVDRYHDVGKILGVPPGVSVAEVAQARMNELDKLRELFHQNALARLNGEPDGVPLSDEEKHILEHPEFILTRVWMRSSEHEIVDYLVHRSDPAETPADSIAFTGDPSVGLALAAARYQCEKRGGMVEVWQRVGCYKAEAKQWA